VFNVYVMLIGS